MTTTRQYDNLNRLTSVGTTPASGVGSGAPPLPSFSYSYNSANQRTLRTEADGSYWRYGYDSLGQVTSGKKYWSDQIPVVGQQFEYAFDDIGNRTQTKAGGDENGANLRSASYSANALNQYTTRQFPGAVDVTGVALATDSVLVNSQAPYRKGEYFRERGSPIDWSISGVHQANLWSDPFLDPFFAKLRKQILPTDEHVTVLKRAAQRYLVDVRGIKGAVL